MLSKCANPACSKPFRYLRDGKLFEIETGLEPKSTIHEVSEKKPLRRIEYFWLCGPCSAELTVIVDKEKGPVTAPLPIMARRAVAS